MKPSRYHPALVALHWVSGALLVAALLLGTFVMKEIPNSAAAKLEALRAHMAGGLVILVLMIARLIVRLSASRPQRASAGNPWLDRIAPLSHYGLYLLVILMASTGLATALLAGLFDIAFGASGAPLPATFAVFPTRVAHGWIAKAIFALAGLHVLAALYHHFILRDGLLRRMWFGGRWPSGADR